jgi:hypothetical protein
MWKNLIVAYFNVSVKSRQSRDGTEKGPKNSTGEFNAELEYSSYISAREVSTSWNTAPVDITLKETSRGC